jgi:hypothetical protein
VSAGTALWGVNGGQLEVFHLKLIHDGSGRGPFISVSNAGMLVVNASEIVAETAGCVFIEFRCFLCVCLCVYKYMVNFAWCF